MCGLNGEYSCNAVGKAAAAAGSIIHIPMQYCWGIFYLGCDPGECFSLSHVSLCHCMLGEAHPGDAAAAAGLCIINICSMSGQGAQPPPFSLWLHTLFRAALYR